MATKKSKRATKGNRSKGLKKPKKLQKTLPLAAGKASLSDFSFTC